MLYSTCLDEVCRFPILYSVASTSVTCRGCGQTHTVAKFPEKRVINDVPKTVKNFMKNLAESPPIKRGPDSVKVLGVSNYHHKLLSPLLTNYGMDKKTGNARLLKELINRPTLDCSVFGDRCFKIEKRHLDILGYGRDLSGSATYLADTLSLLLPFNDNKELLVPLHVDGDGHCLVHAVSRALVGREMFWHPLRVDLRNHFKENLEVYKELLGDFINGSEWPGIIAECDPDYVPPDGIVGLRPIHLFGLANVLRRPLILLDSVAGMNTSADYSAVFLPGLSPVDKCSNKNGQLNPPLCLAWSSPARNHYIPLVPTKDCPLPQFPKHLLPKVWGLPQDRLETYLHFNDRGCVVIGGENCILPGYMLRLTCAMDELFHVKYGAPAQLVVDVYLSQYSKRAGYKMMAVVEATTAALQERRLQRCLTCDSINILPLSEDWLRRGGFLYTLAKKSFGFLQEDRKYPFIAYGVTCSYNARKDTLVVESAYSMESCMFCNGQLRSIHNDGSNAYENGDITNIPIKNLMTNHCPCGFKHWWKGVAYDSPPEEISVVLQWNEVSVTDMIHWFHYESEPHLNSNVYQIASYLLQKHFSGQFGTERLHQNIVQQIMEQVNKLPPPTPLTAVEEQPGEKEEACGGSTPMEVNEQPLEASGEGECSSSLKATKKTFNTNQEDPFPCPYQKQPLNSKSPFCKKSPSFTMLSHTPATQSDEAMDRFLQLMKRKTPPPPDPDSPLPSTSKKLL